MQWHLFVIITQVYVYLYNWDKFIIFQLTFHNLGAFDLSKFKHSVSFCIIYIIYFWLYPDPIPRGLMHVKRHNCKLWMIYYLIIFLICNIIELKKRGCIVASPNLIYSSAYVGFFVVCYITRVILNYIRTKPLIYGIITALTSIKCKESNFDVFLLKFASDMVLTWDAKYSTSQKIGSIIEGGG